MIPDKRKKTRPRAWSNCLEAIVVLEMAAAEIDFDTIISKCDFSPNIYQAYKRIFPPHNPTLRPE